jgi:MarR family transcriptional regulator, multiple antibiotic resistance protein MarR
VTDQTDLFVDLVGYETRLYNRLDERLQAAHGVTVGQFEFLRFVERGDARTVGELAAVVGITVGAVSKGVDRIETAGWLARAPNPANRRSSLLVVTTSGRAVLRRAEPTVAAVLDELLVAPLSARGLAQFADSLRRLRAALDAG